MSEDKQYTPEQAVMIPAFVHFHTGVSGSAKLLYGLICGLSFKFGYCYASNAYFANLYKTSESTISRWVAELVAYKLIKSEMAAITHGNERRITPRLTPTSDGSDSGIVNNKKTPMRNSAKTPISDSDKTPMRKNAGRIHIDRYIENDTNKEQVFAREQTLPAAQPQQPAKETAPTVAPKQPAQGDSAYAMGQAFAEAMRVEMQGRADALASYAGSFYKRDADTFLRKCVTNIAPAAQTCYANEKARINLTPKVAQAYGRLLFNRFEALCENGQGTSRFMHAQTAFERVLAKLSEYCDAFACEVLEEATMGGWETPKTDAAQLAQKYNNWLYTHKQTENLTKVREKVESADKGQKNAFNAAIDVLTEKEIDTVNKAAKSKKVNKRSAAPELKAAARRAYAVVMFMRTQDPAYNNTNDANGVPMGLEAERTGDAVYAAAYAIIKANHVNW